MIRLQDYNMSDLLPTDAYVKAMIESMGSRTDQLILEACLQ